MEIFTKINLTARKFLFVCLEKETKVLFSIVESYQSRKFEERRTTQNGIIYLKFIQVENTNQKKKQILHSLRSEKKWRLQSLIQ